MIGLKDKNVTVVGLARSGVGAANLLCELGAHVTVTDIKPEQELKNFVKKLSPSVRLAFGSHPEHLFINADIIVISPGVSLEISPIQMAKAKGVPVIGELELAYQIIQSMVHNRQSSEKIIVKSANIQHVTCNAFPYFLAVTGTNGKSTTTALLDFMIKKSGFSTILGGNIGNALTEEIYRLLVKKREGIKRDDATDSWQNPVNYIVAEVSSFQLESIKEFKPKIASILNITPDHLDRYHSLKEYIDAKVRIFENQSIDDFLVINRDDSEIFKIALEKLEGRTEKVKTYYFSRKDEVEGLYYKNGNIYCNFSDNPFPLIEVDEIKIKGVHNLENAMAASAMALLAGCSIEAVRDSLREFPGLEHRLEFVREIRGVRYFNDSKGTNVGAVMKSLESFPNSVILIAGGRDKAGDFSLLRDLVKAKVKALVLIGEASEKLKKSLGDLTTTLIAEDLREALVMSRSISSSGDVVLLSPACASFDMFRDFEDRGRQFKKIVREIEE
ncbi:MAG: UDP-N-acetylmuramoyl-L-alanine--D-glutamate ligase [Nitrospirae bacterium]|nr:UDP-N-acetylmuramoyl-L-alanine--D-glutamate ligase [Nitrospirota bacterium]